ncbi:MAG: CRISPR system precrRNA processing endoribonuclease RAMP protein Cas6 [Syntrophus sp. (in: bacteria)]
MNSAPELLAIILHLQAEQNGTLPATNGQKVHGAFLQMVAAYSAGMVQTLHTANQERPFTLSSLRGNPPPSGKTSVDISSSPVIPVVAGGHYWIRITSLKAEVSLQLINMLEKQRGALLKIGAVTFMVMDYDLNNHSRSGATAYADMREECLGIVAAPLPWFGWSFISATTIHSRGRNLLFPEPTAIFPRLVVRWNRFCPEICRLPYRGDKDFALLVGQSLMVAANQLRTHMLEFGSNGRQIGFTGYVEFRPDKTATDELLKLFHLLGRFSFFSGIGYSTPKGMGQVDFIIP